MSIFTTVLFLQHAGCFTNASVKIAPKKSHGTQSPKVACGDPVKRNILLVGTSGRGKSSTGNLIFGEAEVFQTSDSMETKPEKINCEMRVIDGLPIKICDALTIPDERLLPKKAQAVIKTRLEKCLTKCPDDFHFIIFVFSYIHRVTPEEHVAFDRLLQYYGVQFLMTNAIAVFTHGFDFDLKKTSRNGPDFATWYKSTEDPLLKKLSSYMKAILLYDLPPDQMLEERNSILAAIRKCGLNTTAQSSDNTASTEVVQDDPPRRQRFNEEQSVQEKNISGGANTMESASQEESMSGEAPPDCDVEIVLLGKTGTGKSSTGNTILGYEAFTVDSSTLEMDVRWTERKGQKIKVIDNPGLLGTKSDQQMQENMTRCLVHCPNGIHALVLVMRYGTKFTDEEKKVLKLLKNMLGNEFLEKHCILVFTDGESFSLKHGNDEKFIDWCQEAGSDFSSLVKECNNRVVLFHNLTPEKAEETIDQLISFARGLQERYTGKMFDQFADTRNQFIHTLQETVNEDNIQNVSFCRRLWKGTKNSYTAAANYFKQRFNTNNPVLQGHDGQKTNTANPAHPKPEDLRMNELCQF